MIIETIESEDKSRPASDSGDVITSSPNNSETEDTE